MAAASMSKQLRLVALIAFVAAISIVTAAAADPETPAGANVDAQREEGRPDADPDFPELQGSLETGCNDIRDIAIVENGFLVATGAAIIYYQYTDDTPKATAVYTRQHGLPSGNCHLLRRDGLGGVWAHCQGGVGYLAPKANQWQTYTQKNGLAPGDVTSVALSVDGNRVWVSSNGGLATTLVNDRKWQVFLAENPIDIFIHPTRDVVWCRRKILADRQYGRGQLMLTSQFDLASGLWRDIPESENYDYFVSPVRCCFNQVDGMLWTSVGDGPPLMYDPRKNTTRTWPKEPNWERTEDGANYDDRIGEMVPAMNGEMGVWLATKTGLWRFDTKKDQWQSHIRNENPGSGQALLANSNDGKTLYWACEGTVGAYDVATDLWTELWNVSNEADQERQSISLSPDGRTVWLFGLGGIFVGDVVSRNAITINDTDEPGLTDAKFVRFDPSRKLALIATHQGVICADYDGNLKFALNRPAPPLLHRVSRFAFAPDGSEVWCLLQDLSEFPSPAAVLFPRQNRWEVVPDQRTSGRFYGMAFSADGKTVWLSRHVESEEYTTVVQRKPGSSAWKPFAVPMPEYFSTAEFLWVSPKDDELWMANAGCGLLRVKLADGDITQYVKSGFRFQDVARHETLAGDYVHDLVFASDGRIAVCSAGGGHDNGITQIDLETGKSTNYPTDHEVGKLVVAPDDRTVWCVTRNTSIQGFDVQTGSWTHKCLFERDIPVDLFETVQCSPDGAFVWLCGRNGVAVYTVSDQSSKSFVGEDWSCYTEGLCVASDGKHVLCSHRNGIALIGIDGGDCEVMSLGADIKNGFVVSIVPIPGTADYVFSVSHPKAGGLYYVDVGQRRLRKVKAVRDSYVSAIAIDPEGFLWGAVLDRLFCVNPKTGEDRAGLEALKVGEPATMVLRQEGKPNSSRIVVAPRSVLKGRVMPRPEQIPTRPIATSLQNKDLLARSTHIPIIATSENGRVYVTWLAYRKKIAPFNGGVPQIPDPLLPPGRRGGTATGISVYDGQKWLPPQILDCDVRFAWCQKDDLHLLIEASKAEGLFHLVYRPPTQTWAKLHALDHGGTSFCVQDGAVHLACFDHDSQRVCYRLFDGKEWSKPEWFEANDRFDGLQVAVAQDGTSHIVWRDGGSYVAHVSVKSGRTVYSR